MGWTFVVRSTELETYRRCRRAWDLGSLVRQRYVTRVPRPFDFERAIHHALAVYYFPAMDDWKRTIVRPLAVKGFERSMREGRVARERFEPLSAVEMHAFDQHMELGRAMLGNYFVWAAQVDDFDSIFSDHEVWGPIPDPRAGPDRNIGTLDNRLIRYLSRIDQFISDPNDEFWVVEHRLVRDEWTPNELLVADETAIADCFEMQIAHPAAAVAGTIVSEMRIAGQTDVHPPEEIVERDQRAMTGSRHPPLRLSLLTPEKRLEWAMGGGRDEVDYVAQQDEEEHGLFRRTVIRRCQASMARVGTRLGEDVLDFRDPDLAVPPTPSAAVCPTCSFKVPCQAMETGEDWQAILRTEFRRLDEESEDESLRRSSVRRQTGGAASYTGSELKRKRISGT